MSHALVLMIALFAFQTANARPDPAHRMKHTIRNITYESVEDMEMLVSKEVNRNETDDEAFLKQAAKVLGQTILIHPGFSEREAGILRLKSMLQSEDYVEVLTRTADQLLTYAKSDNPVDQATAMVALRYWVAEAKIQDVDNRKLLKDTLKKIADAKLEASDEAKDYGRERIKNLLSPSEDARVALGE